MSGGIPEKMLKYLHTPGTVVDTDAVEGQISLSRDKIFALFTQREKFFDAVPLFHPMRKSVIEALHTLHKKGIIVLKDLPASRKGGCSACGQKTFVFVLKQMYQYVYKLLLGLQAYNKLPELGEQLRKHLNTDKKLVVTLYKHDKTLERVEL